MAIKLKIKKGDNVIVIAGENKGQKGLVKSVDRVKMRVVVDGVNMIKRHTKPSAKYPEGGIIEKEAPIHISNLMFLTSKGEATRVGRKKDESTGKIVRYSKNNGETIK
jgi:large subunit ribosomal protein L24